MPKAPAEHYLRGIRYWLTGFEEQQADGAGKSTADLR
jgi:hypothetical protein